MIIIDIPGRKAIQIEHLVLDFNGTLAIDGKLIEGAREQLQELSKEIDIHIVTADTFGTATTELEGIRCKVKVLNAEDQARQKKAYLKQLGKSKCVAIGNGYNDWQMLKHAALGIVTIQDEGASVRTLKSAAIVCHSVNQALDLILISKRIKATLRR